MLGLEAPLCRVLVSVSRNLTSTLVPVWSGDPDNQSYVHGYAAAAAAAGGAAASGGGGTWLGIMLVVVVEHG
ncbi:hypothetical protein IMY05_006G0142800 [Salix suchowensis]|nr:hypothetical protein IMY05_006G0142800 [Salix suchowensis]